MIRYFRGVEIESTAKATLPKEKYNRLIKRCVEIYKVLSYEGIEVVSEEINLYVDDIRRCPNGFVVARNCDGAIKFLSGNRINILSLDNDLGIEGGRRMDMIL